LVQSYSGVLQENASTPYYEVYLENKTETYTWPSA